MSTAVTPLVRAYVIVENPLYSYVGVNANYMTVVHPSSTTYKSAEYQVFRVNYNETMLDNITLGVQRIGNPNGVFRMALYSVSGVAPNQVPNAAIETSSTDFNPNTLTVGLATTAVWVFAGTTELYVGVDYCWVLYEYSEVTIDATNYLGLLTDTTATSGDILDFYGNLGYYYSSTWNIGAAGTDFVFEVRGSGGDQVEYVDIGGETINYYVSNITAAANVTAEVSASFNNTSVNAGDVSAGDVIASGGVSVDIGGLTANFTDTNVTASSATASIETLTVNATVGENVTMTGDLNLDTTSEPEDFEFYFVIILILLGFFLTFVPKVPLINIITGCIGLSVTAASLGSLILPFPWYMSMLLLFSSLCCLISASIRLKR